uniref:Uncharacterized protein n=1 Tax=Cucumis melo TaxID=3656 RepID=A0A9I9ELV5_CUCME
MFSIQDFAQQQQAAHKRSKAGCFGNNPLLILYRKRLQNANDWTEQSLPSPVEALVKEEKEEELIYQENNATCWGRVVPFLSMGSSNFSNQESPPKKGLAAKPQTVQKCRREVELGGPTAALKYDGTCGGNDSKFASRPRSRRALSLQTTATGFDKENKKERTASNNLIGVCGDKN